MYTSGSLDSICTLWNSLYAIDTNFVDSMKSIVVVGLYNNVSERVVPGDMIKMIGRRKCVALSRECFG